MFLLENFRARATGPRTGPPFFWTQGALLHPGQTLPADLSHYVGCPRDTVQEKSERRVKSRADCQRSSGQGIEESTTAENASMVQRIVPNPRFRSDFWRLGQAIDREFIIASGDELAGRGAFLVGDEGMAL